MTSPSERGVGSINEAYTAQEETPPRRSLLPSFRRKTPPLDEADIALDDALKRLADATRENEGAAQEVRRRQSSGQIKLVSVPPEGG